MRERFEALHPVPDGVQFDEHLKVYYVEPGPHSIAKQLHCLCWSMWRESRAEMVIELPAEYELPPTMDMQALANACRQQDAAAIEAAGVKVKR